MNGVLWLALKVLGVCTFLYICFSINKHRDPEMPFWHPRQKSSGGIILPGSGLPGSAIIRNPLLENVGSQAVVGTRNSVDGRQSWVESGVFKNCKKPHNTRNARSARANTGSPQWK
jgi:hypothetical protein